MKIVMTDKKKNNPGGVYYYNPESEPFFNMAFDNWLFEKIQNDKAFPRVVFRLYGWERPAITLGYNQDANKVVDFNKLDESVPVIRRITGGRAIFHDETEITFSLTADLRIFPEESRSLSKTNRLVSKSIVKVLNSIGVTSDWARKSDRSFSSSVTSRTKSCFNSYSRYEIFSQKGKIVAGAQRRKGNYFIHQGSIKINGISECPAIGQRNEIKAVCMGTKDANSHVYTIGQFENLFPDAFSESLNIQLITSVPDRALHREISVLAGRINMNTK
ncbi:MAG: hypothetical protein DRP51_07530 [Candidatus Zixiibacteriota bacterium]|nr:MAG: hypothetical protein DRP51_07530 [candidate division Zixibacteria bacterium]HHI02484.1 hypothetical protein [candidate division Zixibacteria bacterium]